MCWKIKTKDGKFHKVKNVIMDASPNEEESFYTVTFQTNLENFSIFSNPDTDIQGIQAFGIFGKPKTRLLFRDDEQIPIFSITKDKVTVIFKLVEF